MSKTKQPIKIPFDEKGNQLTYDESWKKITWKDNYTFSTTLVYKNYSRGRSSVQFEWSDMKGTLYYMSASIMNAVLRGEMDVIVTSGRVDERGPITVTGEFTFRKQGSNYFLTPVK